MVKYKYNDKFRIKVTDQCNFACPFCHAEGGKGAENVVVDSEFVKAVKILRPLYSRVHLTGGEPILYKNLSRILDVLEDNGYQVAMTTNGFFNLKDNIQILKRLEYINFSVHSFRSEYVAELVENKTSSEAIIATVTHNIDELRQILPVRINTVVSDKAEQQGVEEILKFCGKRNMELKLVPEWQVREEASKNIQKLLNEYDFHLYERVYLLPGSNVRDRYKNQCGQIVEVKNIEFCFPDFICEGCSIKACCQEGFSFLRMGGNPLYFQPCIFTEKLSLEKFQQNVLPDFYTMFKETEKKCHYLAEEEELRVNGKIIS